MKEFKNSQEIIDFAIKAEEQAVTFYMHLAEKAKNKAMKEAFVAFAEEEKGHAEKLRNLDLEKMTFSPSSPISDLHMTDYINPEVDYDSLDYGEVLVIAMNREKRAFLLYNKLAKMVEDDNLRKVFTYLAKEESEHKNRFEVEYDDFVLSEN